MGTTTWGTTTTAIQPVSQSRWVPLSMSRNCKRRSSPMFSASFSVFDAGSFDNWTSSTVLPAHLVRIRHAVWVTRPSKAMLSTVSVSAVEVASAQCQRAPPMASQPTRVSTNSSTNDQPGLHLQVLRGHPRRSSTQGHPPRCSHQLDRQPSPQAPRIPWTYGNRKEVSWFGQGSRIQQDDRRSQKDLEETQHPQPPTIQIDALAGVLRGLCFFEMQGWILLWCMA